MPAVSQPVKVLLRYYETRDDSSYICRKNGRSARLVGRRLALHGLGGPVCDLARSQPHPAVDTLPQQVGVADVAGVLLDHVDQHLPQ